MNNEIRIGPAAMWNEKVEYKGKIVERFEYLEDANTLKNNPDDCVGV